MVFIVTHTTKIQFEIKSKQCCNLAPLKTPVKIALVSYTNTLPFQWALKHNPPDWPISVISDYPSRCAEYLLSGAADIALLPVGQLKDLAHYTICSPIGIAANGPVDSVKVYSQVPLNQIKTLYWITSLKPLQLWCSCYAAIIGKYILNLK
ncbi:MAG: hypothetical protein EBQ77_07165 [Sphingobacteriia bacterium]|nr:hypothetical protein [Sphingobacteriia bacterium]